MLRIMPSQKEDIRRTTTLTRHNPGVGIMAQDVGGDLLGDAGAIGDAADDLLDAAGGVAEGIVKGKVIREDCEGALCEWNYAAFCLFTERAALAVDQEPAVLPEDVLFGESGQL